MFIIIVDDNTFIGYYEVQKLKLAVVYNKFNKLEHVNIDSFLYSNQF